jgi:soluble lytic murein transglycosylase-like protein
MRRATDHPPNEDLRTARGVLAVGLASAALWLLVMSVAGLAMAGRAQAASAATVRVPTASATYRLQVERAAAEYFGLSASPARLAAQLHQESGWRDDAQSAYAIGLAQFTPATAKWLPEICPELGGFDPWDAGQSIRAAACYDRWLFDRVGGVTACDQWAFTLSAYNGGLRWVYRDVLLADANGRDDKRWFGHVELMSSRAPWAFRENRDYVTRILLLIEPAYVLDGWSGEAVCP